MATLTTYRRTLAPLLGSYISGTATSGSSTSQLECTASIFKSSLSQETLFEGKWLFRPSASAAADKVRVVSTYTPSSGLLVPDLVWTNSPSTETFEVHGHPVEPLTEMTQVINDGLHRCYTGVEFTFSPSASTDVRHSLASAASWLTDPKHIYQVGYLTASETRARTNPFDRVVYGEAYVDGATLYLDLNPRTFNTTDVIYVRAIKRGYDHCRVSGGTYGGQSGLSLETDECPIDEYWLAQAAKLVCLDRYDMLVAGGDRVRVDKERQMAASRFSTLTRENLNVWGRTFRPLARIARSSGLISLAGWRT